MAQTGSQKLSSSCCFPQIGRDPKECADLLVRLNLPVPAPSVMAHHRFIDEVAIQNHGDY